jgi:hypothetical protein
MPRKKKLDLLIQEEINLDGKSPEFIDDVKKELYQFTDKEAQFMRSGVLFRENLKASPPSISLKMEAKTAKCKYIAEKELNKLLKSVGLRQRKESKSYPVHYVNQLVRYLKPYKPHTTGKSKYSNPRITTTVPEEWKNVYVEVTISPTKVPIDKPEIIRGIIETERFMEEHPNIAKAYEQHEKLETAENERIDKELEEYDKQVQAYESNQNKEEMLERFSSEDTSSLPPAKVRKKRGRKTGSWVRNGKVYSNR